jgi:hypothetical protein
MLEKMMRESMAVKQNNFSKQYPNGKNAIVYFNHHENNEEDEDKRQRGRAQKTKKRDKIFINIYSSYLQVTRSVSPLNKREDSFIRPVYFPSKDSNLQSESVDDANHERELTPMGRKPDESILKKGRRGYDYDVES